MMLRTVAGSLALLISAFSFFAFSAQAAGGWGEPKKPTKPPAVNSFTRLPPSAAVTSPTTAPGMMHGAPETPPSEDPAAELLKARSELQKAYDSINAVNPLSASYGQVVPGAQGAGGANGAAIPPPPVAGPLGDLYRLMSNPAVQGYLKLFSNPTFYQGVEQIMHHPRRLELVYAELGFFLFMLLFRAWRMSKCDRWYQKVWTYTWTWVGYWLISVTVLPWAVLGDAYYRIVVGAIGVWFPGH